MRRTLIAGNWKMNGSLAANAELLDALNKGLQKSSSTIAVCVPSLYLMQCQTLLKDSVIELGAQDVSAHTFGAYTGEIAASMLLELGCRFVIVGHSERRSYHGETNESVAAKAKAAIVAGLTPIVCVGESFAEREAGQTDMVVKKQLAAVIDMIASADLAKIVVAYEPVWAIGSGKTATPEMAQEVHALLRDQIARTNASAATSIQILYGGSMKPDNAAALLAMPDIDGGLIGGAALKAQDFLTVIHACD